MNHRQTVESRRKVIYGQVIEALNHSRGDFTKDERFKVRRWLLKQSNKPYRGGSKQIATFDTDSLRNLSLEENEEIRVLKEVVRDLNAHIDSLEKE